MKIESTFNPDIFIPDRENRVPENINKLKASMEKYGWLPAYPMHVVRANKKTFLIKDGQHRWKAAKEINIERKKKPDLGRPIPFLYVVVPHDHVSIPEINNAQRAWNLKDYMNSYASQGNMDYVELKKFCADHSIGPSSAIALLGDSFHAGAGAAFKKGEFKIIDRDKAETVAEVLHALNAIQPWAKGKCLIIAISKCCLHPKFRPDHFVSKCRRFPGLLIKQPTTEMYIELFEKIYNHACQNRIDFKWQIKNLLSDRSPIIKESKTS